MRSARLAADAGQSAERGDRLESANRSLAPGAELCTEQGRWLNEIAAGGDGAGRSVCPRSNEWKVRLSRGTGGIPRRPTAGCLSGAWRKLAAADEARRQLGPGRSECQES